MGLEHVRAYPDGFEFRVGIRARHDLSPIVYAGPGGFGRRLPGRPDQPPMRGLSFGFGYSDGRRLTNLSPVIDVVDPAPTPLLVQVGGYAAGGRAARLFWHWGLPPAGPLAVVVELDLFDVPEARVELDGATLIDAASRAEVLWADEQPNDRGYRPHPFQQRPVFAPESPAGAGPADADAAEGEVRAAFEAMGDTVDGELVNVEDGRALAPVMRDVLQRFGPMAADAQRQVEQVTWASPTEASVVFSLWVSGNQYLPGQRGTAKLIEGRWKMARSTFVGLMASVGVTVPGG